MSGLDAEHVAWLQETKARYEAALAAGTDRAEVAKAKQMLPMILSSLEQAASPKWELQDVVWLPDLGVAIYDGTVYKHGADRADGYDHQAVRERKRPTQMGQLGALPDARAEVVAGKVGKRRTGGDRVGDVIALAAVAGPLALLAGASRAGTGLAVVAFSDGTVREKLFTDKSSLARAQAQAVRFNALAAAAVAGDAASASGEDSPNDGSGVAAELERLAALHSAGVLDDEEFRAAKSRVIDGK